MNNIFEWLNNVIDLRQDHKIKHLMKDIIAIVFFAKLANANEWDEIHYFAVEKEAFLRKYLELPNGIPSYDTIRRVMAIVSPEFLGKFQVRWNEMMNGGQGQKLKKILALDGKTQRGNKRGGQKPNHIVSCVDNDGFCLSQKRVDDKSNEITAIPELLDDINIKGHIVTTDAMGCQKDIAAKIAKKKADYVLALKGNQAGLHEDVKLYFDDADMVKKCAYTKTTEKARSAIETREYWQTDDISWLAQRKEWPKLKSIAMTKNTITKNGKTTTETRFFISSLPVDVKEMARAIRAHSIHPTKLRFAGTPGMVESYHHHLDVTFKEDANQTAEKDAAFNLNIISKIALNALKLLDVGIKRASIKGKRFMTGLNPEKYIEMLLEV
jgi:predicted transposase YbfD/YdcC